MLIALVLAALVAPSDPDGVVTTAPGGPGSVIVGAVAPTTEAHPDAAAAGRVTAQDLTTQQQIDRWLSVRSPDSEPFSGTGPIDDRRIHGFVSGSIGSHDYSSVALGVSLPIGERGRLDLAYSQTKNGFGYGYGPAGYGYGYGFPGDHGHDRGIGYGAGPFGALGSDPVLPGGSGRSVALGFGWDADRDGDDRPMPPGSRIGSDD